MLSENPLRRPVHAEISEALIERLVHSFYAKVRKDEALGPIFARVIGGDWTAHLAKMCKFWSSVMLMSGSYKGNPMIAHIRLKTVRPEHFERWLDLFRETAVATCPGDVAEGIGVRPVAVDDLPLRARRERGAHGHQRQGEAPVLWTGGARVHEDDHATVHSQRSKRDGVRRRRSRAISGRSSYASG